MPKRIDPYSYFKQSDPNLCWEWNGRLDKNGYGRCSTDWAHRRIYELMIGPIPMGKFVLHSCDNRPCVNPNHLWIGTSQDNVRDMWNKGRGYLIKPRKGMMHEKAKLTDSQVMRMRKLYYETEITLHELGNYFGVSYRTVWDIVQNRHWRHLKMYPLRKTLGRNQFSLARANG